MTTLSPTAYAGATWLQQIHTAATYNDGEATVRLLAAHTQDPTQGDLNGVLDASENDHDSTGSALYGAVCNHSLDVVRRLANHPGVDVNQRDENDLPPLFRAMFLNADHHRPERLVEVLLDAGANPGLTVPALRGTGRRTLAELAVECAGTHAGAVLEVLHQRGLLPVDPVPRFDLFVRAVGTRSREDSDGHPRSAVLWLLNHDYPVIGLRPDGGSVLDRSDDLEDLRENAPATFVLVEQAVLREAEQTVLRASASSVPETARASVRPRL